jgi:hypothetical protein
LTYYNDNISFEETIGELASRLLEMPEVEVGEWQSIKAANHPMMTTHELRNIIVVTDIPLGVGDLQRKVKPNLPWAEDHFKERVSGQPLNPPPSEAWWPFAVEGNAEHKNESGQYSHTYPERFWPKTAGWPQGPYEYHTDELNRGIRYPYGDLNDVIDLLGKSPGTRQAFLPVWFPEDTGGIRDQRVPCTIGYHFLIRQGEMEITYFIRSCDFVRYFRDDLYMAARLCQWVCQAIYLKHKLRVQPSVLVMHMISLHVFPGDRPLLEAIAK